MTQKLVFPKITLTSRVATIAGMIALTPLGIAFIIYVSSVISGNHKLDRMGDACMYPFGIYLIGFIFLSGSIFSMMKDETIKTDRSAARIMGMAATGFNSFACFVILCIVANHALRYQFINENRLYLLLGEVILGCLFSFLYGQIMKAILTTFFRVKM